MSEVRPRTIQEWNLQQESSSKSGLQRYYVDHKEAKLMQWHTEREKPEEDPEKGYTMRHRADAAQWEALDIAFPSFGATRGTSGWA